MEDNRLEPGDVIYAAFIPPEWVEHYIRAMDTPLQQCKHLNSELGLKLHYTSLSPGE